MRKILSALVRFAVGRPKTTIGLSALVVLLCALGLAGLKVDIDVTNDLPADLPAKVFYDKVGQLFPSKDFVLLAVKTSNVFAPSVLADVHQVSKDLGAVAGVYSIMSPTDLSIMEGQDDTIVIANAVDDAHPLPTNDAEVEAFRTRVLNSGMPLGNLISKDHSALSIMVLLKAGANAKTVLAGLEEVIARYHLRDKYEVALAGKPVTSAYAGKLIANNMMVLFPGAILVIFLLLFLIFRSLRGLLIPVAVVVSSSVIAIGLMTFFGRPFSMSTSILPIIVASLSVSSSIHIIRQYYYVIATKTLSSAGEIVTDVMAIVNMPLFYAAVTAMAGFLALTTSGIGSVATLAIFTAVGILAGFLLSVTFIPACLTLLKVPSAEKIMASDAKLKGPFLALGNWLVKRPVVAALGVGVVVLVAAVAIPNLNTDSNSINGFPKDDPIRKADTLINTQFAGSYPLTIVFQGQPGALTDPKVLRAMEGLEAYAATLPHVGGSQSLVSFVKRLNKVMHGGDPAYDRLPNDTEKEAVEDYVGDKKVVSVIDRPGRELVEAYLSLVELQSPDALKNSLTEDRSVGQMVIFLNTGSNQSLRQVEASIDGYLKDHFQGLGVDVKPTGLPVLFLAINDMILQSQVSSLLLAFVLVLIICSLLFRSLVAGVLCTVPLLGTVALNFGLMAWLGITLDIQTMLISSIVIGVGVDYAIHFLYRTGVYSGPSGDVKGSLVKAMESEGVSIFWNAAAVAIGFLVLAFSASSSVQSMGLLIAFNMFSSSLIAILFLPWPLFSLKPQFLFRVHPDH